MTTKYYLAAKYGRKDEMKAISEEMKTLFPDWECTATWTQGSEEGKTAKQIASMDLMDVGRADTFILFTYKRGSKQSGGGRFVEFGYALAKGLKCFIIGEYENVFTHHPTVTVYPTLAHFYADQAPVRNH